MRQSKRTGWGGPREGAGQPRKAPTEVLRLPVEIADFARRLAARGGNSSGISAFLNVDGTSTAAMPLMSASVACGFPSPAEDHLDATLDFNELVGARLPQTFAVRAEGDSMIGAGILHRDIIVICRMRQPRTGDVVVACVNNEFTLKTYIMDGDKIILHPENPSFPDIVITKDTDFEVFGVMRNLVRSR